jgi:TatD DNase family protein
VYGLFKVKGLFGLVDSHCHLDLEHFEADRDEVIQRARAVGVKAIVNPGIDLLHCQRAIELSQRYPELYAAVGIHPNSSDQFDGSSIDQLRELAAQPKVVALGEIGLDYYWDRVAHPIQQSAFEAQLELAAELDLPVIIHCRDANAQVMATLAEWAQSQSFRQSSLARRPLVGVLHAFPGDWAMAEEAYAWGFAVSLGGPITFRNAQALHELATQLRIDRLMLETDAPYLTPHPHRGQRNEPANVALVCQRIAHLRGLTPDEVTEATGAVAASFFRWGA